VRCSRLKVCWQVSGLGTEPVKGKSPRWAPCWHCHHLQDVSKEAQGEVRPGRGVPENRARGWEGSCTNVNLPAACLVTAATTPPPLSFPFFFSFFAPFMVSASAHGAQTAAESARKASWWMRGEEGPGEDEPGIRIGFKSLEQFPAPDTGREPCQV
jgi:hypothetical protein